MAQWARKFKKVQAKKTREIKIKIFFSWNCISGSFFTFIQFKNWFLVIFEIAKNIFFVKLIYLISRIILTWTFLIFLAYYGIYKAFLHFFAKFLGFEESLKNPFLHGISETRVSGTRSPSLSNYERRKINWKGIILFFISREIAALNLKKMPTHWMILL